MADATAIHMASFNLRTTQVLLHFADTTPEWRWARTLIVRTTTLATAAAAVRAHATRHDRRLNDELASRSVLRPDMVENDAGRCGCPFHQIEKNPRGNFIDALKVGGRRRRGRVADDNGAHLGLKHFASTEKTARGFFHSREGSASRSVPTDDTSDHHGRSLLEADRAGSGRGSRT